MSEPSPSPYQFQYTDANPSDNRPDLWSKVLLVVFWLVPNAIGSLTFLISLVAAGRPVYRMWLQAFGFVSLPCGAILFFLSLAAVAKRWNAVLTAIGLLYSIVAIVWIGICCGVQVYDNEHRAIFTAIGSIWLVANLTLVGHKFSKWLRR